MSALGQKIIAEVRRIARDNPDFVYQPPNDVIGGCVYVSGGQPSCLIGHALWSLRLIDASLEFTSINNGYGFPPVTPNEDAVRGAFRRLGIEVDSEEADWLSRVQHQQDNQHCWGSAIEVSE